ncbi:DUF3035 domain-containing protein [Sphingomicrobium lutaoense]|uniref:Putative small lipoprotein YifL n=1 Tax=Sphingomicrobium lutaoense TaxID=515949 RepID=A0A839Z481_9SPHN|nr:DUF3035 domain-containing protein [Sphingomicrobium lutaoense]MBB3764405.1 putative small lipoprotein YifL [Sphingomicrobium lutaoense]
MRKTLILLAAPLALTACGSGGSLDEFAVQRNAPLVIPPDYTLEPPAAGTVSSTATGAQAQAIEALFGGPAPRSAVERAAIEAAGSNSGTVGTRSTAGDPDTRVVDKGADTSKIIAAPETDGQDATADVPQ